MKRENLAPGVFLNTLDAQKFNRCRITIRFQYPACRETATASAVLPLVLERCCADYPDMTLLSRRLAKLYGADLSVDNSTNGANRVLTVSVTGIKDEFALEGEDLTAEYADLVFGVAFRPYLVNGLFDEEAVAIERGKLRQQLQAEVNDKRLYCVRQARRRFFGDSLAGVERDGYLEEVDGVTPQLLTQVYEEMLCRASIEVTAIGAKDETVRRLLLAALEGRKRDWQAPLPGLFMPRRQPDHQVETMDMVQAKLCLLFTAGRCTGAQEIAASRLAMALYGGSVTSRLFLNVREKQSLCYYCSSSYISVTGCMMVDSGVEPANARKAEAAILKELAQLCDGPITDEEMEDCRRGLLSSLESVEDSLSGLEGWYFAEIARGGPVSTPAQARAALEQVTKEQVRQVLRQFTLSVSYLLTPEVNDHA